jgi:hypothetical protein
MIELLRFGLGQAALEDSAPLVRSIILCHHLIIMSPLNVAKKPRGRPPVDSERVTIRIERTELEGLDYFATDPSRVTKPIGRPEAIRRILRDWLMSHGYVDLD